MILQAKVRQVLIPDVVDLVLDCAMALVILAVLVAALAEVTVTALVAMVVVLGVPGDVAVPAAEAVKTAAPETA